MAGNLVTVPFVVFHDIVGQPINGGYIYVGTENVDTIANPISVYWDSEMSIPATQPIRTVNGYPARNGSPGNLYVAESAFSMIVKTSKGATAFSRASMTSAAGGGSDGRLNVKNSPFFAMGDGVTDDTAAIQAAIDAALLTGQEVYIPYGNYMVSSLSVTVSTAGKGPFSIVGDGAPDARSTAGRGSLITQIAGTTADLIALTGDWGTSPNYPIVGVRFDNFSLRTSAACTGWALDLFNVTDRHSSFTNMSIYVPNAATTGGGIRAVSCWCNEFRNIQMFGPSGGTTSRGFVLYGEATGGTSDGTPNMTVLENLNIQYFGLCNMQLGKWAETGGGFAQSITVISGQSGHSEQYGVVIGRILDVTIIGHHTEANGYSGWLFDDDATGNDPTGIKLINCDSYNDGLSGTVDTADSYGVQINRGNRIHLDMFRFLLARAGIYIADSTDTRDIMLDSILFAGDSDNTTSRTALYVANASPDEGKRVTMGYHSFVYTWGNGGQNVVENPGSISWKHATEATATITDANGTIECFPWVEGFRIAANSATNVTGTADNGAGLIRITSVAHGLQTGDKAVIASVGGTTEANGVWTVTRITADTFDLDGSTFANPWTAGGTVTLRDQLTNIVAPTNYYPAVGQTITLYFNGTDTEVIDVSNSGNFRLKNGVNWLPRQYSTLTVTYRDTYWVEVHRSANAQLVTSTGNNTFLAVLADTQLAVVAPSGAVTITEVNTGGEDISEGKEITCLFTNSNSTIADGSTIQLAGGANFGGTANDTLTLVHYSGVWYEKCRSVN